MKQFWNKFLIDIRILNYNLQNLSILYASYGQILLAFPNHFLVQDTQSFINTLILLFYLLNKLKVLLSYYLCLPLFFSDWSKKLRGWIFGRNYREKSSTKI